MISMTFASVTVFEFRDSLWWDVEVYGECLQFAVIQRLETGQFEVLFSRSWILRSSFHEGCFSIPVLGLSVSKISPNAIKRTSSAM